jgi:hypothetical protein
MLLIFLKIINQIFHKFINFNSENNNLNNNNNAHKFLMMKKKKIMTVIFKLLIYNFYIFFI